MLPALLLVGAAAWVPARWSSTDPKTLELLRGTPVNCLVVEQASPEFAGEAAARGLAVLLAAGAGEAPEAIARRAAELRLAGVVLEGGFQAPGVERARRMVEQAGLTLIELPPRALLRPEGGGPVVGTAQGLWPGIRVFEDGAVRAAPTGGPWVETNTGLLRYLRAASDAAIWIANRPPPKAIFPVERYLVAIADAAIAGARWVVALDEDFQARLYARQAKALAAWERIAAHLRFYEDHGEWRSWKPAGRLALIQDEQSGALLSGGVLDMIAVKHAPVRPVPRKLLSAEALRGARVAVNVDPAALSDEQKEILRGFTRSGGVLLSGPPGWKFPLPEGDRITLEEKDQERLNEIWREVNSLVGRRNLGARLFNVSGMLSNLAAAPDGKQAVLHLVNFTSQPAENITVHLAGSYGRVRLLSPEAPERELAPYAIEEGVAVEIERIASCAALLLDWKE
jgi:hypothetical protein